MKFGKWFAIFAAAALLLCFSLSVYATEPEQQMVSPALAILAQRNAMAKAGLTGEDIGFHADEFERALNVSSVESITVTKLPERSDGILYLGGSELHEGQTVSRANISHLTFVFMSEDITDSAFCFSTNHGAYELECALYRLEYENRVPVVSSVSDTVVSVSTYRDISVYGRLDAYDPDGDEVTFEIVSYPKNGLLTVTDSTAGTYKYTPVDGFTGTDRFRYVAVDRYGNYSDAVWVTLTVSQPKSTLVYCDLEESSAHVAAISMTERGVMASAELAGNYYFYPSTEVTRAEFLAMAMKTKGIHGSENTQKTVFADDGDIPVGFRGYVNTAQRLGYVCGKLNESGELVFCPNDTITRYEAAVMLYNMSEVELPVIQPLFVDADTVPVWAKDAVYSMTASGVLSSEKGYISANAPVTRELAAEMLYKFDSITE